MGDDRNYELLIRLDEKVSSIHREIVGDDNNLGLKQRVDDLESAKDSARGWIAGAGATFGVLLGLIEWLIHKGHR